MANFGKWIGGGLGWALGGPIGAVLGFVFGSMFDGVTTVKVEKLSGRKNTSPGDFKVSLLMLIAAVMRADDKILKTELDFVKKFLITQFGIDEAQEMMILLRDILKQPYNVKDVLQQISQYMDYSSRLQMMHLLFGVALADSYAHPKEIEIIQQIGYNLGIQSNDFESIKAMFIKDDFSAYKILEITPDANEEEIKKAYRRMAMKYHPDKVNHLGEDVKKSASEKFKEVNEAYQKIKKIRGLV